MKKIIIAVFAVAALLSSCKKEENVQPVYPHNINPHTVLYTTTASGFSEMYVNDIAQIDTAGNAMTSVTAFTDDVIKVYSLDTLGVPCNTKLYLDGQLVRNVNFVGDTLVVYDIRS